MIRLTSAAAVALLWWLASAAAQTAPASAGPVPSAVIEELVLANRILNDRGVLDAYGHVSIRHPSDPGRYRWRARSRPAWLTAETSWSSISSPIRSTVAAVRCSSSASSRRSLQVAAGRQWRDPHAFHRRDPVQRHADAAATGDPYASFLHVRVPVWRSATPAAPPTCWCATASSASP